jgi:ABC-type xylose transport system substrate-binding protein
MKTLTVILLTMILSACAVMEQVEKNPLTSELITNQLTLRFIAADDDPVERSLKIQQVVTKLQTRVDGEVEFTLVEFEQMVRQEIDWQSISPADQELLNFAFTKARQVISDLIGEGVVEPDERYTLVTLLTWVNNAAMRVR